MRVRTFLLQIRLARNLSIGDVANHTGLAKGEVSMFERGHAIPRGDQADSMQIVYGPREGWYPATVARALLPDLPECPGCGEELEPEASGARVYHSAACRAAARRAGHGRVVMGAL